MSICNICPRSCSVDRAKSQGYCRSWDIIKVSRASLHMWEEPCISGSRGSGTVFFTGCNLRCVYCQNYKISGGENGRELTVTQLAQLFLELQKAGAHNINLVTPTHFAPQIKEALNIAKSLGLSLPVVYNTSGYESIETLKSLNGLIDIYLTDFKYFSDLLAKKYSSAPDYPDIAKAALYEMVSQTGTPFFDDSGMMQNGTIVRQLILPGYAEDSKDIIKYLYDNYESTVYISIMNQFTPLKNVSGYPELCRKVSDGEYKSVVDYAIQLGVENAFIQEGETQSESFIPDFDCGEILNKI